MPAKKMLNSHFNLKIRFWHHKKLSWYLTICMSNVSQQELLSRKYKSVKIVISKNVVVNTCTEPCTCTCMCMFVFTCFVFSTFSQEHIRSLLCAKDRETKFNEPLTTHTSTKSFFDCDYISIEIAHKSVWLMVYHLWFHYGKIKDNGNYFRFVRLSFLICCCWNFISFYFEAICMLEKPINNHKKSRDG